MTSHCLVTSPKNCQFLADHLKNLAEQYRLLSPPHCRLALLDLRLLPPLIEQSGALTHLLSPAENNIFQQFHLDKRRLEWLGGRVAAKYCVHQLLGSNASPLLFHQYSIRAATHGCPHLERASVCRPDVALSISHSRGYAAALACQADKGSCGIDIQHLSPKLANVAERFTHEGELNLIDPLLAPLTRLGLIWTAKEAVKKCLLADHPLFFGKIQLTRIKYDWKLSLWTAQCRVSQPAVMAATVRIAEMDTYLVACATGDAHA
jgi:phosphopantetheinyl transferase